MNYCINDDEWVLIDQYYDVAKQKLSPVMSVQADSLFAKLAVDRRLTSSEEADLLITVLLIASQGRQSSEDASKCNKREVKNAFDVTNLVCLDEHIFRIIDQLRLFSDRIKNLNRLSCDHGINI